MNTMRMIAVLAFAATEALAGPAFAHDARTSSAPQASVFPTPPDPWRSWGVRAEAPRHFDAPPVVVQGPRRVHERVWVPGQWVWDGATWLWWPAHWGVR
jgi:hypothetical protein